MNPLCIPEHISWQLKDIKEGESHQIQWNEIITVVSGKLYDSIKWELKTFESSAFYRGSMVASEDSLVSIFSIQERNIMLDKIDVDAVFWEYCRKNWKRLSELPGCEKLTSTDLYRGDQVPYDFQGISYKFNLWFCGANVDCLWHNQHNFIETHTNLAGAGYMQKSCDGTDGWLEETYGLLPGNSHRTFNIAWETEANGNPKYPMHRWLGGNTGNVWFVIEKY